MSDTKNIFRLNYELVCGNNDFLLRILSPKDHPHAHVNYCGHQKIFYENQIEYLDNSELHRDLNQGFY